jgi:hypothetical protein
MIPWKHLVQMALAAFYTTQHRSQFCWVLNKFRYIFILLYNRVIPNKTSYGLTRKKKFLIAYAL